MATAKMNWSHGPRCWIESLAAVELDPSLQNAVIEPLPSLSSLVARDNSFVPRG